MVIGVYIGMIGRLEPRRARSTRSRPGSTLTLYSMPEWWLGPAADRRLRRRASARCPGSSRPAGCTRPTSTRRPSRVCSTPRWHLTLPVITLTLAYLADYSLVMRSSLLDELGEDYLVDGARQGPARRRRAAAARRAQRAAADDDARPRSTSASWSPGRSPSRRSSRSPASGCSSNEALDDPGLLGAAGHVPDRVGRRDRRPTSWPTCSTASSTRGCGHERRRPQPAHSAARCSRRRRSAALRRTWRLFRANRVRACSGWSADLLRAGRRLRAAARRPRRPRGHQGHRRRARAAVRGVPAGHRRERPLGADPADLGLAHLAVRRAAGDADLDGDRHPGRADVRVLRGVAGRRCCSGSPSGSW